MQYQKLKCIQGTWVLYSSSYDCLLPLIRSLQAALVVSTSMDYSMDQACGLGLINTMTQTAKWSLCSINHYGSYKAWQHKVNVACWIITLKEGSLLKCKRSKEHLGGAASESINPCTLLTPDPPNASKHEGEWGCQWNGLSQ